MTVFLFVDSFTRYWTEEGDPPDEMLLPDPKNRRKKIGNRDAIHSYIVNTWMPTIAKEMGSRLTVPLSWNEKGYAHYDEQIGYEILMGLKRAAAFHEVPHLKRPGMAREKVEESEDAETITTASDFPSRFTQLYPMYWLPVDFNFTFFAKAPFGEEEQRFGSSVELLRQLGILNDELFKLSDDQLFNWEEQLGDPKFKDELDYYVRWGLCVFTQLAKKSVEDKLPMRWG